MTLKEFIELYDKESSTILLEGKREVQEIDKEKLVALGIELATKMNLATFRSGNADGADYYFSLGVVSIDPTRLEVITPYTGHRKKLNLAYNTISLDTINITGKAGVIYQSKQNKKTEKLIDQYISGDVNRFSIKARIYTQRHN